MWTLPRPVWLLGWVSLFTDSASEAIYAILPFFLTRVLGATVVSVGIIEGAAEAANSLLKVASGYFSDRFRLKRPVVLAGYAISSVIRPLTGLATIWEEVLAIRFVDRIGKGIRGAPRDAMLASWARPETRGRVYGFHRAMDNTGAVVGPLFAAAFLLVFPERYRELFGMTVIPGAMAVALLLWLPETPAAGRPASPAAADPPPPIRLGDLPRPLAVFLAILALFTLGNSTDAFLLLRLTDVEGSPITVLLLWAGFNAVKAALATPGGVLSDRLGRRRVIAAGWLMYAVVYAGFAFSRSGLALTGWFFVYGLYYALTEGAERALMADLAPASMRGTVFGLYNAVLGIGSLVASVVFGVIWKLAGAPVAFGVGAILAVVSTLLLLVFVLPGAGAREER
ncbi:MAG: MFS transporter [Acidobacteriota bacterium]|nr:MFS transporter [Acidobacteriota bacterium]